jgi:hypothetical protein
MDELISYEDVIPDHVDTNTIMRKIHVPQTEKMIREYSRKGNSHLNFKEIKYSKNKSTMQMGKPSNSLLQ